MTYEEALSIENVTWWGGHGEILASTQAEHLIAFVFEDEGKMTIVAHDVIDESSEILSDGCGEILLPWSVAQKLGLGGDPRDNRHRIATAFCDPSAR